ncbi:hypothetical protein ABZ114_11435 [Streptomyces albidoflavus]|uniref:hypothetical protein n=1 Tax=Streptomyces TaxID=1883 RepID=UPI00063E763C|nr:hypothetical protein [Streptomyces sp. KE1]KLI97185.1 hypothetical protein WQ59_25225 [Streptomyces sp. KE1]
MSASAALPLLFLDVDGTLLPYGRTRVDDEITGLDRAWVARHHRGPALLHRVDPVTGLTAAGFAVLGSWLRDLAAR